jgi:hypothetical protein
MINHCRSRNLCQSHFSVAADSPRRGPQVQPLRGRDRVMGEPSYLACAINRPIEAPALIELLL